MNWNSKILLAKLETVYSTDPVPTGAANAVLFNANEVTLAPMEGQDVKRDIVRTYLGNPEMMPTALNAKLSFSTELAGSGAAGTAPPWGPLMRGCSMAEVISAGVSATYNPITSAPESVTFYFWVGATQHIFKGSRGTWDISVDANGIPKINWTFFGLWTQPAEVAAAVPTYTPWQTPLTAGKTNTPTFSINAVAMVLRSYKFTLANDVQPRFLIGKEEMVVVDRSPELTATVEAVPLTTLNPYALAAARTKHAIVLTHGVTAGNIVTVNAATSQIHRPSGLENNQNVVEWPLKWWPRPNAGNDELSIVCT